MWQAYALAAVTTSANRRVAPWPKVTARLRDIRRKGRIRVVGRGARRLSGAPSLAWECVRLHDEPVEVPDLGAV
jgi:hypothetical protein